MQLSVLQWNIWFNEKPEHIVAFLKANPADVVCLQELTFDYHTPDVAAYIAEHLGYNYFAPPINHPGATWRQANGIFTKLPIVATHQAFTYQSSGTEDFGDQDRLYVQATIGVGDTQCTIGTTHLAYSHAFTMTPGKEQEADRLVTMLQAHKHNFIFTGDLNATPGSSVVRKISSALTHVGPDFQQPTWTTKPFSYNGFETATLDWRLDYIFATPDVQVLEAKTLKTTYSDHLPVFASFKLS